MRKIIDPKEAIRKKRAELDTMEAAIDAAEKAGIKLVALGETVDLPTSGTVQPVTQSNGTAAKRSHAYGHEDYSLMRDAIIGYSNERQLTPQTVAILLRKEGFTRVKRAHANTMLQKLCTQGDLVRVVRGVYAKSDR